MKLIVMTQTTFFVEEDKILTTLFEEGLELLHLYKPGAEPILSERLLSLIDDSYHKRIVVHDHFYLKEEFKLKGIHLNRASDPTPPGYRGPVSCTCHSTGELKEAKRHNDYVFLKTLFDSQTNPADKQTLTYAELEQAARQGLIDRKVAAMGGMNFENLHIARDLGFGAVVICGDLWNRFNIHHEIDYKSLLQHFLKLRKAAG
jgi:thiamine-phosphate pyrophosphorylase